MSDVVQTLWGFCHTLRHEGNTGVATYPDEIRSEHGLKFTVIDRRLSNPRLISFIMAEFSLGTMVGTNC